MEATETMTEEQAEAAVKAFALFNHLRLEERKKGGEGWLFAAPGYAFKGQSTLTVMNFFFESCKCIYFMSFADALASCATYGPKAPRTDVGIAPETDVAP